MAKGKYIALGLATAALLSAMLPLAPAGAQNCAGRGGANAIPGTLAAPAPCKPAARAAPTEPREPKQQPGVFRSGNTTIRVGGSVNVDTTVRGR